MTPRTALTFDTEGGEELAAHSRGAQGWADLLDLLDAEQVPATFFLQGDWVARHPGLARRTAAAGHLLGNHTLNHLDLGAHPEQVRDQVQGADAVIRALVAGADPGPWFRLPYLSGAADPAVAAELAALGVEHVDRNCDSHDWNPATHSPQVLAANVLRDLDALDGAAAVVMLHTWPRPTVDGVARLIAELRARPGHRFVTVDDLAADERAALAPARG